ncbi:MAG: hypothetical protein RL222_809, partial [Bacteroidota bacterium]
MRILFLKNNLLSILGILIGVLFFTCLTKLSDKAMCEEYKLFSKKGVRIKAVVDHFSNYRA